MSVVQQELLGRAAERERIAALLETAQLGHADRLALVGDAGMGKSALLEWARVHAKGFAVLSAAGVEPEQEVAFAGLLELLRSLLGALEQLPTPQRGALEGALALGPPQPGARFAVGAGVLGLLAGVAEQRPLLVLLDDVQWIDEPTREAVAFACRRLGADCVAVLAASRPDGLGPLATARLETIGLGALAPEDAGALVARSAGETLASAVAERLVEAGHGNPLALVELPQLLTTDELTGVVPLPETLRVGRAIERSFLGDVAHLPEGAQLALLAAAAGADQRDELWPVLALLGLPENALEPAERAGLLRSVQDRIVFRHPLVRSALLDAAPAPDLRRVHAAYGQALPPGERRARHRAAACSAPDEQVAKELETAASDALARRAPASAISLLEQAVELSPDATESARRLVLSAEAAWIAGLTQSASRLAERVLRRTDEAALRADALHLLGQIAHQTLPPRIGQERLREAADLADRARSVPILTDLFTSFVYDGKPAAALETARRLWALHRADGGLEEFFASHCLGIALLWNGQREEGEPLVRRALELVEQDVLRDDPRHLAIAGMDAAWVDDAKRIVSVPARAIAIARASGALAALPALLKFAAWADFDHCRWSAAYATASEAVALAEETGQIAQRCACLGVLLSIEALTGREESAYRHAREALALADELELPWHRAGFLHALGWLELGLGRPERALELFEESRELIEGRGIRLVEQSSAPDHIEALVRLGRADAARARLEELAELTADGSALARSLLRRCQGLLAPDNEFEPLFREALALHPDGVEVFWLARTRLCFGERLRRAGSRREGRAELEAALKTFERLGAEPWATRAHAELVASGSRLRRRSPEALYELTPQELQVAVHVARGLSNREIAQTLFLSPKTVERHVSNALRKLGARNRAALAAHVRELESEHAGNAR